MYHIYSKTHEFHEYVLNNNNPMRLPKIHKINIPPNTRDYQDYKMNDNKPKPIPMIYQITMYTNTH